MMSGVDRQRSMVVTGAARGIGFEVARRFAAAGDRVVLVDLDPAVEERASQLGGTALCLDVTDPAAWEHGLASVRGSGPPVGGLVACAGILGQATPVEGLAVDDFRRIVDINLTGTFVSAKAVLGDLLAAGRGRIVNIASIAGKEGNAGQSAYSASKGGVIAFTKALAREVASSGITVNCIAPTIVDGPFADAMSEELRADIRRKIPMNRFGTGEEVAALVAWICSPECSFTTGFCFDLTGGRATY